MPRNALLESLLTRIKLDSGNAALYELSGERMLQMELARQEAKEVTT